MKISTSALSLSATHHSIQRDERRESLRIWRTPPPPAAETTPRQRQTFAPPPMPHAVNAGEADGMATAIDSALKAAENDPFLSLIRSMIEALTGEVIHPLFTEALPQPDTVTDYALPAPPTADPATPTAGARAAVGIVYDASHLQEDYELTRVDAKGTVTTADGQKIDFSLQLVMERYYRHETHVSMRTGDAVRKDPLVLNFNGRAAELLDQRFRFDLNGDGADEELALLRQGSGFLSFDRNGNGRIDNGQELFGPVTNAGFEELSRLDSDGNGWLDEADPLFSALSIWQPAHEGPGILRSIADVGIGAISLGEITSPFQLRGADNTDLGTVRSTGLYLDNDGNAGTVQEIDLTI